MALDMRLDLSSIEKYQFSYVQNSLWKMNSSRYEAPSSNRVVMTIAKKKMKTGSRFFLSRARSIKAPTEYMGIMGR